MSLYCSVQSYHPSSHQIIMHDPSSPWGYEIKHAALHMAGEYENAIQAFEEMLSKLSNRETGGEGLDCCYS